MAKKKMEPRTSNASSKSRRTEEALRESEAWLALAAEAGGVGVYDWDIVKDSAKCSDQFYHIYGVDPRNSFSLAETMERVHEDDRDWLLEALDHTLEHDASLVEEYRVRWPDGSIHWIRELAQVTRDNEGRPVRLLGALTDITEKKQAEEALRESEERYRDYYEEAPDAYLSVDPDSGLVIECNRTAGEMLDRPKDQVIGHEVFDFYTPESFGRAQAALQELQARGVVRGVELQLQREDGKRMDVSLAATAVKDDSGRVVRSRSMWRDITGRKQAEEAHQRLREELEVKAEAEMLRENPYGLTFRELTVLHLVAAGLADKQIAQELDISFHTASRHVKHIMGKMEAASRTDAGVRAVRERLID